MTDKNAKPQAEEYSELSSENKTEPCSRLRQAYLLQRKYTEIDEIALNRTKIMVVDEKGHLIKLAGLSEH